MTIGYDEPLYILPFDHRASFSMNLFGWGRALGPDQAALISAAKLIVYRGFKAAVEAGVPAQKAGILVDQQFGRSILRDAAVSGFTTACSAEKSGQAEFDFEYGEQFAQHIEACQPTFCKALVRYNPEGDRALNRRQTARLKRLSDYLHDTSRSRFMFELLVPPERAQLERFAGDGHAWDMLLRPRLVVQAIEQLQDAGIEPDVWEIEGLDRRADCVRIVAAARRGGRDHVGCVMLGRDEEDRHVRTWLSTAAAVPGFIGFAAGRTIFWDPLVAWRARSIARNDAVAEVARRFHEFVDVFEGALPKGDPRLVTREMTRSAPRLGEVGQVGAHEIPA